MGGNTDTREIRLENRTHAGAAVGCKVRCISMVKTAVTLEITSN